MTRRRSPDAGSALPLAYLSAAAVVFAAAAVAVPWLAPELAGHYYQPRVLALTHTITLGWITMTIMGASYQLVPVVLERPVWSAWLASCQLGLVVIGTIGLVGHFFIAEQTGLVWGAGLVALGAVVHVVNIGMSLRGLERWSFTAVAMTLALGGLTLTAAVGTMLGLDHLVPFLPWPFFPRLHAHFHLALLGWVLPMIVGVAARVYPMFLLAHQPGHRLAAVQLIGLALGVPLVVGGILDHPWLLLPGTIGVAAVVACHLWSLTSMLRARRRPCIDWGLRFALTGAAFLLPASLFGVGFAAGIIEGPRLGLAYAALGLGGWASLTIVGMTLKIVPFLVWYRAYGATAGREPVPTIAELSSPTAEAVAYAFLVVGMLALPAALIVGDVVFIRLAGLGLAAGALAFVVTLARALRHVLPRGVGRVAMVAQDFRR